MGGEPYNTGQIHQALEQLERSGWAVSRAAVEAARSRRRFRITPAGRAEFVRWLARPAAAPRPARDDMLLKLVFLAERDRTAALRLLEARRRELLALLGESAAARSGARQAPPEARYAALTLEALRLRLEADLRWVDHCTAVLRPSFSTPGAEAAEEPPPLGALEADQYASGRSSASDPPSAISTLPQKKLLSGPSRKAATAAICSGLPKPPSGIGKPRIAGP